MTAEEKKREKIYDGIQRYYEQRDEDDYVCTQKTQVY